MNIHLHNCEQFAISFLAVAALGGTSTTSNPAYTGSELVRQQQDSGAKFVLISRQYGDAVSTNVAMSGVANCSYIEDDGDAASSALAVSVLTA